MRKFISVVIFILVSLVSLNLQAAPVAPMVVQLSQPDGTTFSAIPRGDEYANWIETADGHTIIKVKDTWYYAEKDSAGKLRSSGRRVGSLDAIQLQSLPLHLMPAKDPEAFKQDTIRKIPRNNTAAPQGPGQIQAISQTQYVLTILVNYSNRTLSYTDATFQALIYGASNSVKDHFLKSSYNGFTIAAPTETSGTVSDGIIRVTRPVVHPNHADDFVTSKSEAREIVSLADPYINYASYDADGDGSVSADELSIVIILAGYETSYGGAGVAAEPNVYGHKSGFATVTLDGKDLSPYTMFGEAHAVTVDPAGAHISTIGIMAHELGHLMLGLPDLYDTDYTSEGIGNWGLMGGGEWNTTGAYVSGSPKVGDSPSLMSGWSKVVTGFTLPQDIDTNQPVVLFPTQAQESTQRIWIDKYRVFEYFLLEYRQKTSYDLYLPGSGMLIWHADERISGNTNESLKLVDLEEADGFAQLDSSANAGDALDPFPGLLGKTTFNDASNPNSKNNASNTTGIGVTSIAELPGFMTASITSLTGGYGDHVRYDENGPTLAFSFSADPTTAWWGNNTLNNTANSNFDGVDIYVVDPTGATIDILYYTSMSGGTPAGLIHTQAGFNAVPGWNRLLLTTPQSFPAGSERGIVVKVVTDNSGPGSGSVSIDDTGTLSGRAYVSLNGVGGYFTLCAAICGDFNLVALLSGSNTAPTFTPAPAITRQQGSAAGGAVTVGTVSDTETAAGALLVTQIGGGTATGITTGSLSNTNGTVSATLGASCSASTGTVRFQVSDGDLTGTGDLQLNVQANNAPSLGYANKSVDFSGTGLYSPIAGPSDNGSVTSVDLLSMGTYAGSISVNAAGVVSIADAQPVGTHTITVRAVDNCLATRDASFQLQVNATVPGAPAIGAATAGDAQATVTFTPPVFTGGSAISGFTVTSSPGGITGGGTASPITVTGLTNDVTYTFSVTATNAAGTGPASGPSNPVTPTMVVREEEIFSSGFEGPGN